MNPIDLPLGRPSEPVPRIAGPDSFPDDVAAADVRGAHRAERQFDGHLRPFSERFPMQVWGFFAQRPALYAWSSRIGARIGRDAQRRPCRLAAAPLHEIADWVATYRQFWEQRFDRLEDYLRTAQQQPAPAPASTPARKKRTKPHGRKSK